MPETDVRRSASAASSFDPLPPLDELSSAVSMGVNMAIHRFSDETGAARRLPERGGTVDSKALLAICKHALAYPIHIEERERAKILLATRFLDAMVSLELRFEWERNNPGMTY